MQKATLKASTESGVLMEFAVSMWLLHSGIPQILKVRIKISSFPSLTSTRNYQKLSHSDWFESGCMTLCPGFPTATASKHPAAPETARPSWAKNMDQQCWYGKQGPLSGSGVNRQSLLESWIMSSLEILRGSMLKVPIPTNINFATLQAKNLCLDSSLPILAKYSWVAFLMGPQPAQNPSCGRKFLESSSTLLFHKPGKA